MDNARFLPLLFHNFSLQYFHLNCNMWSVLVLLLPTYVMMMMMMKYVFLAVVNVCVTLRAENISAHSRDVALM